MLACMRVGNEYNYKTQIMMGVRLSRIQSDQHAVEVKQPVLTAPTSEVVDGDGELSLGEPMLDLKD